MRGAVVDDPEDTPGRAVRLLVHHLGDEELLAHDVVLRGDGGGKAPALKRALHGRARVAHTLIAGLRAVTRFGITWRREEVNGQRVRCSSTAKAG